MRSDEKSSRPRRWGRVVVAVGLVLIIVGVAVYWVGRDRHPDPATVELPPAAADQGAVLAYLTGDGRALLEFLAATEQVQSAATAPGCAELAGRLDTLGSPADLITLAQGVPDPGVRDAAVNHLDAVGEFLAACGRGAALAEPARQVTFSATVLRRLFEREGAR